MSSVQAPAWLPGSLDVLSFQDGVLTVTGRAWLPDPAQGPLFQPVTERFKLNPIACSILQNRKETFGYGPLSEFVFFRTYSREITESIDGVVTSLGQERLADVIIRVIQGLFSIRKDHFVREEIAWDEDAMQQLATQMAISAFDGEWGPPGRGYWALGTEMVYQRGSMALNNCGFVDVQVLSEAAHWAMDALMMGVGVGFSTWHDVLDQMQLPGTRAAQTYLEGGDEQIVEKIIYQITDDREGWCDAILLLLNAYETGGAPVYHDYSQIRPRGSKIAGFGGTASGPAPLRQLIRKLRIILNHAVQDRVQEKATGTPRTWHSSVVITDTINLIGCCIVAGNVRRSATIALGAVNDPVFAELKHYADYDEQGDPMPTSFWYRRKHGWMSNNSIALQTREDFEQLPAIADGIRRNGEPGFVNMLAAKKRGRMRDKAGSVLKCGLVLQEDPGIGFNPCVEVVLQDRELCCLGELYPTRCRINHDISLERYLRACDFVTFYTQTVQLLMTHRPETNAVIQRNRRTGISMNGAFALREYTNLTTAIQFMEEGYERIRAENLRLSREAKVNPAIRVTAEKPSGTTSLMWGVPPGCHPPLFPYEIRRVRVTDDQNAAISAVLQSAGVPFEPDTYSDNTMVYEFPLGPANGLHPIRPSREVSMWEAASFAGTLADHFVDNAVSVTVNFDPMTRDEKAQRLSAAFVAYQFSQRTVDDLMHGDWIERLPIIGRRRSARRRTKLADALPQNVQTYKTLHALQERTPEADDVERLVADFAGKLKSMSMLPRGDHGYAQAPDEEIDQLEYEQRLTAIQAFDWSSFLGDGQAELYCAACAVP